MKKKLIFVTRALWIGGIETALVNLLGNLNYEKYTVTCLVLGKELTLADRLPPQCRLLCIHREQGDYPYTRLYHLTEEPENPSRRHRRWQWLVPALRWVENRLFIRHVRKSLGGERFDTAVIYSDAVAEAGIRGIKAEKYLLFYHHGAMRRAFRDEIVYEKCRNIVTVSRHQAAQLARFRPSHAGKIRTVHNFADPEGVRRLVASRVPYMERGKFHIVTCGRLHPDKGMDLAVAACAKLVTMGFTDIRWHLMGDGPAEGALRRQIAALGMEKHVILEGARENPYPLMAAADIYVQPSRVEGYPMSLLEAMGLGKAVVSTDNPGAREILTHGRTGLLCDCSPEALAEGLAYLLEHPQERLRLAQNAGAVDLAARNREEMEKLEALL